MNEDIKVIQQRLMHNLERLDNAKDDLKEEALRSNAITKLANAYIQSCNLIISVEKSKGNIRSKIGEVINNEK